MNEHFDAVIIGSGFGGSVTAYRLAQAGKRVCILERGKRYPPGSFARSPEEMRTNFWDPSAGLHGLYQLWNFGGMDAVVSAGVGGGSLIYANVLIRKDGKWFRNHRPDGSYEPWPIDYADLDRHYDTVEQILKPVPYPTAVEPYASTPKTAAYAAAAAHAGYDWHLPNLAVTFANPGDPPIPGEPIFDENGETTDNLHGRTRQTCRLCGECDIGCNYGAKNTLDWNYLTLATMNGAQLRDRREVRGFAPRQGGGYQIDYVEHLPDREGNETDTSKLPVVSVTADSLVLAAGTFGSTFLLLKNASHFPGLNLNRLGHNFSGNGDALGFIHNTKNPTVLAPSRGPVITSTIRVEDRPDRPGFYIQDGGYPGFGDWLYETSGVGAEVKRLGRFVWDRVRAAVRRSPQTDVTADIRRLLGDAHRPASVLPLLGMGMDTPDGVMSLETRGGQEYLKLDWTSATSERYLEGVRGAMNNIADALDGEFTFNPLWHLHHKLITVHPLGGCPMGRHPGDGVTDVNGEVFGYPGFVIADGSVIPGPVGPNPSLTIAALANKFAEHILSPSPP